uniref:Nucleoside-diphosphate-sugar epimerases n=1 Tax=uncultured marine thaumarchaeote AD1000_40_H03 TaxID=1455914 RepID=A0A075FR84_9ARCH|nr:Nucleoside-diphosphate-sugar epimerases [uncultured marine thaumarchaeote AD1000_40_H03]
MNIFVTGGAGFIGSFLTKSLLENGYSVTIYDSLVISSADNAKN